MDCSLVLPYNATPPNLVEKTFVNSHKTLKFGKVSPLKVSHYTVALFLGLFVYSQLHPLLLCINCKIRIENKTVLYMCQAFFHNRFVSIMLIIKYSLASHTLRKDRKGLVTLQPLSCQSPRQILDETNQIRTLASIVTE